MRLIIPLTGTVVNYDPPKGDPNDPIRLIEIDLGNVSWELVNLDLENEVAEIEVAPGEQLEEAGEIRPATEVEKQSFLTYAQELIYGKTKDELYSISKSERLKKL